MSITKFEKQKIINWVIKSLHTRHEDWKISRRSKKFFAFSDEKTGIKVYLDNGHSPPALLFPIQITILDRNETYFYVSRWNKSGLRKILLEISNSVPTEGFSSFLEITKSTNCVEQGTKRMPPSRDH